MADFTAERQSAFGRLSAIVEKLVSEGRPTRSAGIKPALQFSDIGFDEKRLGFRSFRAFLEEAERAGYVNLRPAAFGPDVDVLPAAAAPGAAGEPQVGRIRRDLWTAFVDWRADWARVYDRQTDSVGWLPLPERSDESEPYASLRRAVANERERYVRIEPFNQGTTLAWMHDFVDGLDDGPAKRALATALTSPRPIRAFVAVARESGVHEPWNAFRLGRVRERIGNWAAECHIELDLTREYEAVGMPHLPVERRWPPRPPTRRSAAPTSLDELRNRVCRAVRRMSRAELMQLAIPLEYVLEDDSR